MCLGNEARQANKAARRQYQYQMERRERGWMQQLTVYRAKGIQHEINTDNAEMAAQAAYTESQRKRREARGDAELKYQDMYAQMVQNSQASDLAAAGRTGRSIKRIGTAELAQYGRGVADIARQLTTNDYILATQNSAIAGKTKEFANKSFAELAFQPIPDVAPPRPVMQNVGAAMFMDALKIGSSIAGMAMPFKKLTPGGFGF